MARFEPGDRVKIVEPITGDATVLTANKKGRVTIRADKDPRSKINIRMDFISELPTGIRQMEKEK